MNAIGVHLSSMMDALTYVMMTGRKSCPSIWENQRRLHIEAKMEIGRINSKLSWRTRRRMRWGQAF